MYRFHRVKQQRNKTRIAINVLLFSAVIAQATLPAIKFFLRPSVVLLNKALSFSLETINRYLTINYGMQYQVRGCDYCHYDQHHE